MIDIDIIGKHHFYLHYTHSFPDTNDMNLNFDIFFLIASFNHIFFFVTKSDRPDIRPWNQIQNSDDPVYIQQCMLASPVEGFCICIKVCELKQKKSILLGPK